jgi:hypothetical protein
MVFEREKVCIFLDSDFWHGWQYGSPGVIAGKFTVITPAQPRVTIVLFSRVGTDMSVSRTSPPSSPR